MKIIKTIILLVTTMSIVVFSGCSLDNKSNHNSSTVNGKNTSDLKNDFTYNSEQPKTDATNTFDTHKRQNQISDKLNTTSKQNNGIMIPVIIVWNGNLYKGVSDKLTDDDIEEFLVDSENISVYSVKNQDVSSNIAYRVNGKVHKYVCVYSGPLSIHGVNYYFVPKGSVDIQRLDEKLLGSFDGFNVYQSNNEEYVVVDISSKLGNKESDFYEAKKCN